MLSAAHNELLTRVGPGTPMGELMRKYWTPACLSSELAADGEPMRLLLLGEQLIAFRDSAGRVSIMEHRCPHRCASLPATVDDPDIYCRACGGSFIAPSNIDWLEAYAQKLRTARSPQGVLMRAQAAE